MESLGEPLEPFLLPGNNGATSRARNPASSKNSSLKIHREYTSPNF
jgi:hypothetical protein